ncbi:hypothetical protein [Cupriavidus sp. DF5525]|uniref:hypothetical protein n=1 Tax=Cupriavidus sp. DF5525 TaxID=3160989 RepID=UPI0032DFB30B
MNADQAAVRQAIQANCNTELLRELQAAHRIIRNTLGILSVNQKAVLAERNARDGVDGEGITRAHEREAVIKRAGGVA